MIWIKTGVSAIAKAAKRPANSGTALPARYGEVTAVVGGYSTAGASGRNSDAFTARIPESESERCLKGIVSCIADGISTSNRADEASQTAVIQFANDYYDTPETWTVRDAGSRVLLGLNRWMLAQAPESTAQYDALVTTFTALILRSHTAYILHSGDCRVYRYRSGKIECLTRDHVRTIAKNEQLLTSALGFELHLNVDYQETQIEKGDLFLLATDGVHQHVSEDDLIEFIEKCQVSSRPEFEHSAKKLCTLAGANGSKDDRSALFVRVEDLTTENIDEAHRRLSQRKFPPALDVGQKIDRYTVERILHSGTKSLVYLVRDSESGERLVLKAPSPNFEDDLNYLEEFHREMWVARQFDDPGLMKACVPPESSKYLYMLFEYLHGRTLRQWMQDTQTIPLARVREIIGDLIRATRVLHRAGMVHRDLKPENVIISEQGSLKIIDFGTVQVPGLADIAQSGSGEFAKGSVDYVAPETLLGQRATTQSDLFSIGCITYELLSGRVPYELDPSGRRWPKTFSGWSYKPARYLRKDIPDWLDYAVERCVAPDPTNRYVAMSEFFEDLKRPGAWAASKRSHVALKDRDPLTFWKCVSLVLAIIILVQWVLTLR